MWNSEWYPAPTTLNAVLAGIWSVQADQTEDLAARVLPDGTTCMVFQRDGTELRSCDDDGRPWSGVCISGPRTGPLDIKLKASGRILIVQLRPAGAIHALGVHMSLLADTYEPLEAVIGSLSQRIGDCLLSEATDIDCVHEIENWLLTRLASHHNPCAVTDAAVQELDRHAGQIGVAELANHVNRSRRQLGRIVRQRVGIPPKLLARITRFHHAVQISRACPLFPWAKIACDAGYSDQAHMSREFSELGGIRPSDLRGHDVDKIW